MVTEGVEESVVARIRKELLLKLVSHINGKDWWHVPPVDPEAYAKRGKFYSSTFREAEFWGRPLDTPESVRVSNPLVGDERTIMRKLGLPMLADEAASVEERFALDARMKRVARKQGHNSIVLMSVQGFAAYKATGKIPRSIELNVLGV